MKKYNFLFFILLSIELYLYDNFTDKKLEKRKGEKKRIIKYIHTYVKKSGKVGQKFVGYYHNSPNTTNALQNTSYRNSTFRR